jgi:hypothetical protein
MPKTGVGEIKKKVIQKVTGGCKSKIKLLCLRILLVLILNL